MPEGVEIKGFPTLLFYTRDKKEQPLEYLGARDADSIISFINEHRVGGKSDEGQKEL